ncbi:hypothetical protein ES711_09200 [Gelidibacter salicanalis]|uniref:Uncharacterized protein n=1 Tax=Gelidibacter salicanalis TaxID=291193 RepID=A0A5C7AM72_9FLAO|nr:hypothetical protein [Gelidibacter salicanalis]TXE08663.1 hypothetical protein ES711_09200 [Gelidibacter salicanalis]
MKPIEKGQIVRFHTPNEDEDPNQTYVVLEVFEDGDKSRAKLFTLDTGLSFPPVIVVYIKDLVVDELLTNQLHRFINVEYH